MPAFDRSTTRPLSTRSQSMFQLCDDNGVSTSDFVRILGEEQMRQEITVTYTDDQSPGTRVECYGELDDQPRKVARVVVASALDQQGNRRKIIAFGIVIGFSFKEIPFTSPAMHKYRFMHAGVGGTSGALAKADLEEINKTISGIKEVSALPQFPGQGLITAGPKAFENPSTFAFLSFEGPDNALTLEGPDRLHVVGSSVEVGKGFFTGAPLSLPQFDLGPVKLRRASLEWDDPRAIAWLALEADLTVGPLTAEMSDLRLGFPFDPTKTGGSHPAGVQASPGLGLGVDFRKYPLHVGAAVVFKETPPYKWFLEGAFMLETLELNFDAYGALMRTESPEFTSMFAYGKMVTSNGVGWPPLVVFNGFCVGFGYNSEILPPDPLHVEKFPLMISSTAPDNSMAALRDLNPWIKPQEDSFWGTLGVQATILEKVDVDALVLVDVGQSGWSAAVLGAAHCSVPAKGGPGRIDPAMYLEMTLAAEYASETGLLAFASSFTPESYVLMKAVKITGHSAFYIWLDKGKPHGGDWVAVAGGYNPGYDPPHHYPRDLTRIGGSWTVSSIFSLSRGCYVAITPSAVMAGVELTATLDLSFQWKKGVWPLNKIKVGFTVEGKLGAHGILQWHPFHFKAEVTFNVRATVNLALWNPTFEVSARGSVWISPFGGELVVDVLGGWLHRELPFGAKEPKTPAPLTWQGFADVMLPARGSRVQIAAVSGRSVPSQQGAPAGPWLFTLNGFTFTTYSHVPATSATLNDRLLEVGAGKEAAAATMNVRPLGIPTGQGLRSVHVVKIRRNGKDLTATETNSWRAEEVTGHVPSALWGAPLKENAPIDPGRSPLRGDPALTEQAYVTGTRVSTPKPTLTTGLASIPASALQLPEPLTDGRLPLDSPVPDQAPVPDTDAVGRIAGTLLPTAGWRSNLYSTLQSAGFDPTTDDRLVGYQGRVAKGLFTAQPLLV